MTERPEHTTAQAAAEDREPEKHPPPPPSEAKQSYDDCDCVPSHRCDCWDYRRYSGLIAVARNATEQGLIIHVATRRTCAEHLEHGDDKATKPLTASDFQGSATGPLDATSNHYDWFMPENPTAAVDDYLDDFEAKMREALTDPFVHDMAQSVLPLIAAYRSATGPLNVDFIAAVQALTEEVYIPHHTPSSESGPEDWDVELLAPDIETVERVIRHLVRLASQSSGAPK